MQSFSTHMKSNSFLGHPVVIKMGTQPVRHFTNLQTMCPANFRIWLTFDHNNIKHNHQQNSKAPEQVYLTCRAFIKIHQCKATK